MVTHTKTIRGFRSARRAAVQSAILVAALVGASACATLGSSQKRERPVLPPRFHIDARAYPPVGEVVAIKIPVHSFDVTPDRPLLERLQSPVVTAEIVPGTFVAITEANERVTQLTAKQAAERGGGADVLLRALGDESTAAREAAAGLAIGALGAAIFSPWGPVIAVLSLQEAARLATDPQRQLNALAPEATAWSQHSSGSWFVFFPRRQYRKLLFEVSLTARGGDMTVPYVATYSVTQDFPPLDTPADFASPRAAADPHRAQVASATNPDEEAQNQ
ncbi:MAG: hypothetical protein ACREQB_06320 [Candidatus Binataceae bacterium]